MAFLRKLFWIAVFLISTLCFVVLFEHGTANFGDNLNKQIEEFRKFAEGLVSPAKGKKDA